MEYNVGDKIVVTVEKFRGFKGTVEDIHEPDYLVRFPDDQYASLTEEDFVSEKLYNSTLMRALRDEE